MMGETGQTIFAVSDVHGHYTELMAALEQAGRFGLGLEMGTPVGVAAILRRGGFHHVALLPRDERLQGGIRGYP